MEKTDDELIAEYISGNSQALQDLIERYSSSIYNFISKLTNRSEDTPDITQETFIKVWKMVDRYKMTNTFKSWIFTIARNTAIDKMRKKKSIAFSEFDDAEGKNWITETVADEAELPDSLIDKAIKNKLLDEALKTLSPSEKEILLLHYGEEMTFDSLGKMLKEPLNTIKSRHRRALAKLKEILEKT